jgi:dipeptidase E
MVFFASSPDEYEINDSYAKNTQASFNFDGFGIENLVIIDHRFKGDLEKVVMSADVLFLAGGYVPAENAFFKEIKLKECLEKYNGVIIGQSAGSMNCAKVVYAPPEITEDLEPNYQRFLSGLGLTNIRIMPHMGSAFDDNIDGKGKSTYDYCIEDSFEHPVYGIYNTGFIEIHNGVAMAYGKTLLIKNGKSEELCDNKEKVEISEDYNKIKDLSK